MLLALVVLCSFITVAISHSTHNEEQQVFPAEHLQELQRKWGTDVSRDPSSLSRLHTN
jgi:hypothetical protein